MCGCKSGGMAANGFRRARTWHYRKMRPCVEQSKGLVQLSPYQSWQGCIINTSGCDFRKGHPRHYTDPVRTASPLWADMIFGKDTGLKMCARLKINQLLTMRSCNTEAEPARHRRPLPTRRRHRIEPTQPSRTGLAERRRDVHHPPELNPPIRI